MEINLCYLHIPVYIGMKLSGVFLSRLKAFKMLANRKLVRLKIYELMNI